MGWVSSGLGLTKNRPDPITLQDGRPPLITKNHGSSWIERLSSKTKLGTLQNISTNLNTCRPQIQTTQIEIERDDSKSKMYKRLK